MINIQVFMDVINTLNCMDLGNLTFYLYRRFSKAKAKTQYTSVLHYGLYFNQNKNILRKY